MSVETAETDRRTPGWRSRGVLLRTTVAALVTCLPGGARAQTTGFAQGPMLVASDSTSAARQGSAVALSGDGTIALVGAPNNEPHPGTSWGTYGAAWVFTWRSGEWAQTEKLFGAVATGEPLGGAQGSAVAVSGDGNTAAVGGPAWNGRGAVWFFTRDGDDWSQLGEKLTFGQIRGQRFGSSISLSLDGATAAIGAPTDSTGSMVYVLRRAGSAWTIEKSASTAYQFGASVALSGDGTLLMVGAPGGNPGRAFSYQRSDSGSWQEFPVSCCSGSIGLSAIGSAVAVAGDGNTAILGGSADDGGVGAAWIVTWSGTRWTQQGGKLVGTGGVGTSLQGSAVALSPDGNTAFVAGPGDDGGAGAVWVFTRTAGVWTQTGEKLRVGMATAPASRGQSLALSADGTTALVGSPGEHANLGGAWIYRRACGGGDANGDGRSDVADVLYLINYLFAGGPTPACR